MVSFFDVESFNRGMRRIESSMSEFRVLSIDDMGGSGEAGDSDSSKLREIVYRMFPLC